MKIDTNELRQVAAAQAPRPDMYCGIHKALRALMADTLLAVGRMDADDADELARVTQRVVDLVEFCGSHLKHENDFVHPALEARAAGAGTAIAHEHDEHLAHIAQLAQAATALRRCALNDRLAGVQTLYRDLALFIADNFHHMHVEETTHNAVLWERYTDAELVAIHDALVASIPPQQMIFTARWMVPFMNPAERTAVLSDIRAKAPARAFEAILETVQPHLQADEWAKLARSLDLAPVPSLMTV